MRSHRARGPLEEPLWAYISEGHGVDSCHTIPYSAVAVLTPSLGEASVTVWGLFSEAQGMVYQCVLTGASSCFPYLSVISSLDHHCSLPQSPWTLIHLSLLQSLLRVAYFVLCSGPPDLPFPPRYTHELSNRPSACPTSRTHRPFGPALSVPA